MVGGPDHERGMRLRQDQDLYNGHRLNNHLFFLICYKLIFQSGLLLKSELGEFDKNRIRQTEKLESYFAVF